MRSLREEVHGGRAAGLQGAVHADVHHRQIGARRGAVGLHLEVLCSHMMWLLLVVLIAMRTTTAAATAVVAVMTRMRIPIVRLRRAAIAVLVDLSTTATTVLVLLLLLLLAVLVRAEVGASIHGLCTRSASRECADQSSAIAQVRVHLHGRLNLCGRCVRRLHSCCRLLRGDCSLLLQRCEGEEGIGRSSWPTSQQRSNGRLIGCHQLLLIVQQRQQLRIHSTRIAS